MIDIVGQIGPDFIEAREARKGVDVFHDGAAVKDGGGRLTAEAL